MSDKYPRHVEDFTNLSECIDRFLLDDLPKAPLLSSGVRIVTQGSCFARNVFEAFQRRGTAVTHFEVKENSNTPMANALGLRNIAADGIELFRTTDLVVFTLGVSFEAPTEKDWRFWTAAENEAALEEIVHRLRLINPNINIVLTLSPVPLNRSIGLHMPAIMADCVSKSILRTSLESYMRRAPKGIFYWPSFEIVRWIGSHTGPVYGADDSLSRHVNNSLVALIIEKFMTYFAAD